MESGVVGQWASGEWGCEWGIGGVGEGGKDAQFSPTHPHSWLTVSNPVMANCDESCVTSFKVQVW